MNINYLSWFKDLETRLHGRTDLYILLSSSINEPTDLLLEHLKLFHGEAKKRLDVPNLLNHPFLVNGIAKRYNVFPQDILVTHGVSNAIYLVCRALLSKNDHVVIESPVYEPIMATPDFIGSKITYLKRKLPEGKIDIDELKNIIKPATKLVLISNLHNPSGALLNEDNLKTIADAAREKNENIKILVDEIYQDFAYGEERPAATLDDCFISLNSLTKVYGLGVIHCGWVIADPEIIGKVQQVQVLAEGSGSRLLESFASFIMEDLDRYLDRSARIVSQNREILSQQVKPLLDRSILSGFVPRLGCIYFPKINGIEDTEMLTKKLAQEFRVYVTPGRFFGEPGHIRIGFGGESDNLNACLERFVEGVLSLTG